MEKTYDHVNWGYVDWVLVQMGFGVKWRNLIRICISSPTFSVLVNGSSKGFFKRSRGLRQGDPLSPYLFILVADLLGRIAVKAESVGVLRSFPLRGGMAIPFIQFTDNYFYGESGD